MNEALRENESFKISPTKSTLGEIMAKTISMNLTVKDYTSRVIGVVKEKYGLKDKGQALDKFAEMFGDEFVDREVKDEVVKDVIASSERHFKKYGFRTMTFDELDRLTKGH